MNVLFTVFPAIFSMLFFLVCVFIGYTIFRAWKQEKKNDHAPRLTVAAKVVAKRTQFYRGSSTNHMHHGHTTYFVTFEVSSGDRMELSVAGQEYGLLVEGDFGDLTFQGTRFLQFNRKVQQYDL